MAETANKHRIAGKIILSVALIAIAIACSIPLNIQSSDVYLATAMQKTLASMAVTAAGESEMNLEALVPTPDQTPTPSPTPTPRIVGSDNQFVIHRVRSGETLGQYAEQYQTTEGAIIRVNYTINLPLWEDTMVVIPVGFSNVAQMPYFQPFLVTVDGLTLEDLANELATSQNALVYYNGLSDGKPIKAGDWLIIPRMAPGY